MAQIAPSSPAGWVPRLWFCLGFALVLVLAAYGATTERSHLEMRTASSTAVPSMAVGWQSTTASSGSFDGAAETAELDPVGPHRHSDRDLVALEAETEDEDAKSEGSAVMPALVLVGGLGPRMHASPSRVPIQTGRLLVSTGLARGPPARV